MSKEEKLAGRLKGKDWVDEAITVFKADGIDSVKIDPIAKRLGVSRGSFYWHFNKRQDLLDAILDYWQTISTENIIIELEQKHTLARDRLNELMIIAFSVSAEEFSFERAIRSWATTDKKVSVLLHIVDTQRMGYLQRLIQRIDQDNKQGRSETEIQHYAHQLYYCRTGLFHQAQLPKLGQRQLMVKFLMKQLMTV